MRVELGAEGRGHQKAVQAEALGPETVAVEESARQGSGDQTWMLGFILWNVGVLEPLSRGCAVTWLWVMGNGEWANGRQNWVGGCGGDSSNRR